jgi:hypothetical protein
MCKKSRIRAFYITILLLLAVFPARADGIKVVEYYTSQGCPACPAGDRVFSRIANSNSDIVALGCHVTYFNRRWQDSMSRIFCDARQGAYRESGATRKMYTPQIVVNGRREAIGNREDDVREALKSAPALPRISLVKNGEYIDIDLPDLPLRQNADVWLFAFNHETTVRIGGGSNAGKTVSYARPVTNLTKLLSWNGNAMNMSFPVRTIPADGYAVIAQYRDAGIIAAGKTN